MSRKKKIINAEGPEENVEIMEQEEEKVTEPEDMESAGPLPPKEGEEEPSGEEAPEENGEPEKDERDAKIEELNDRNLRLMAEFENFRKRTDREKEQMFESGARSIIEKVLPVIDNFERALDMSEPGKESSDEASADPFMDGMLKIYKQLMDELSKMGVKPIEAVGKEFDPEFHNAVMQVDSEEYESGTVASELQKGYMYKDSVVRHSMVGVAK